MEKINGPMSRVVDAKQHRLRSFQRRCVLLQHKLIFVSAHMTVFNEIVSNFMPRLFSILLYSIFIYFAAFAAGFACDIIAISPLLLTVTFDGLLFMSLVQSAQLCTNTVAARPKYFPISSILVIGGSPHTVAIGTL